VAVQPEDSENAYNSITTLFDSGDWERCIVQADSFRLKHPNSRRLSSVIFLTAQSALKLRALDRAQMEAQRLKLQFPDSEYIDDARMIEAECALLAGRWEEAERHLDWTLGFADDLQLSALARRRREELQVYLATLKAQLKTAKSRLSDTAGVGLILPITGAVSEAAESFLRGFEWYRKKTGLPQPLIWDSEGDAVRAVRLFQAARRDGKTALIIGGLEDGSAAALAAIAQELELPFLTTACADEGLAAIGPFAFQGRADNYKCGQALAHWAIEERGLNRFAALVSNTKYGRQFARGFRNVIEAAGGRLLVEETYYPGTSDFSGHLRQIRAQGMRLQWDDSLRAALEFNGSLILRDTLLTPTAELRDTLLKVTSLTQKFLDSLWNERHKRINRWMETTGREVDSLGFPLQIFDGILLVTEPGAIEILSAQYARYNFRAQLLGDENWAIKETLLKVSRYIEGMVFVEPFPTRPGEEFDRFSTEMRTSKDGGQINRYHLAGERAARMAGFAVKRIILPGDMRETLALIRGLPTLSGPVAFVKEERVARDAALIQFSQGEFKALEK